MDDGSSPKTIILFGVTGAGKSTLANALLGISQDDKNAFDTGHGTDSVTQDVESKSGTWLNHPHLAEIKIIDTPGHGDSKGLEADRKLREKMIKDLRKEEVAHAFLWVIHSSNPRLSNEERTLLAILQEMFGDGFYKNLVVIITHWKWDERSCHERERQPGKTLERYIGSIKEDVLQIRRDNKDGPNILAIDAWYSVENIKEKEKFFEAINSLQEIVGSLSATPIHNIEMAKTNYEKAKDEIETLEKEMVILKENQNKLGPDPELERQLVAMQKQIDEAKINESRLLAAIAQKQSSSRPWWQDLFSTVAQFAVPLFLRRLF